MFRTFWKTCSSPQELDEFLNSIVTEGYQPWIYRESRRAAWDGRWYYVVDVYVTAFQTQVAPKQLPESGCKFHSS